MLQIACKWEVKALGCCKHEILGGLVGGIAYRGVGEGTGVEDEVLYTYLIQIYSTHTHIYYTYTHTYIYTHLYIHIHNVHVGIQNIYLSIYLSICIIKYTEILGYLDVQRQAVGSSPFVTCRAGMVLSWNVWCRIWRLTMAPVCHVGVETCIL